jgi:hypothetical protein
MQLCSCAKQTNKPTSSTGIAKMHTLLFAAKASYQLPFCDRFGQARLDNGRWLAALTTHIAHEICRIAHSIAQTTQQETQVLENKALLCAVAEYVMS